MTEEWRDIPGYEGYYQVSDLGNVRSLDRWVAGPRGRDVFVPSRVISQKRNGPYPQVGLFKDGTRRHLTTHVLVALVFIGARPEGMQVCHNDGDKQNNNVANLRYGTPRANGLDTVAHGGHHESNKTHCKWGHEFIPENTNFRLKQNKINPYRVCLTCRSRGSRIHYIKKRDNNLNPQEKKVLGRA